MRQKSTQDLLTLPGMERSIRIAVIEESRSLTLPTAAELPRWLSEARKALGWSLADVAHHLGDVTRQAVHYWEKGKTQPSTAHLARLVVLIADRS